MQIPPITIEEVANQFEVWRKNKSNKFEPIPDHLKGLVKHLLPHYPKKEIISYLHITSPTISSIQKQNPSSINQHTHEQNVNFIPFQIASASTLTTLHDSTPVPTKQENIICQIIKPNGTKLVIPTSDPKSIIQTFICCN